MNKNLKSKLAAKAERVRSLQSDEINTKIKPYALGKKAFQLIGGSYGKTINPYDSILINHSLFRAGFKDARKIAKG